MPFLEDVVLTESIEIKTTPERIFSYLTSIVDDESFKTLHSDNVCFRWLKGQPWMVGSVAYAEKYLHNKLHKFRFVVTEISPNRHIEYAPVSRLMKKFFPRKEFTIERKNDLCIFISTATFRVGWIGKTFFKRSIDNGLASFRKYLREEGENLKTILESQYT